MADWYYARNNQRLGPASMEQLKQLAASGQLGANDLVWQEGMANWAPASTIPGLISGAPAAPSASPTKPVPVAPAPKSATDEVVDLPTGRGGSPLVDTAKLIALRAVAPDLDSLKVADDEKSQLTKAGFSGDTAQRYLVWRRSLLWVALVPLAFTGLSLVIDSAIYTFEHLNGFGVIVEILRLLTLLALPAAAAVAALNWAKPQLSTRLVMLGFFVCFGLPLAILMMLPTWYLKEPAAVMHYSVLIALFSIPPGVVRSTLRSRTLLPEATATGLLLVGLSLMSALFFFGVFFGQVMYLGATYTFMGMLFGLLISLAPLSYVIGAKTFLRPIASAADRSASALWQWIYYGLCGAAAVVFIVDLLMADVSLGAYGVWIGIFLFLDFLGRSLFVAVFTAQVVLWATRVAKADPTVEKRLSELEPIIGKL